MSIKAITNCWEHSRSRGNVRLVLIALADFANDKYLAWPAHRTLAQRANISISTVQRALAWLLEHGEIHQAGSTSKGVVKYRIVIGEFCAPMLASDESQSSDAADPAPADGDEVPDEVGQIDRPGMSALTDQVGQIDRGGRSPLTEKPSLNRQDNHTPLNPLVAEGMEKFKRLVKMHPGASIGNFQRASDLFVGLVVDGYPADAIIAAADAYGDQVTAQGLRPCSLDRWLREFRFMAHPPTATAIDEARGDEIQADEDEAAADAHDDDIRVTVTLRIRDHLVGRGLDPQYFRAIKFLGERDGRATIGVPSDFILDRIREVDQVEDLLVAALEVDGLIVVDGVDFVIL